MSILSDELTNDPLGRGYSGMTLDQAVASLNDVIDRSVNKDSMSGDEIFNASDATEFAALTDTNKSLFVSFCGRDSIDPFATGNVELIKWIFGAGSTTVTNLNSLRTEPVSRAVELGLGVVRTGDVEYARTL